MSARGRTATRPHELPAAAAARAQLDDALDQLAAAKRRTPCQTAPEWWTSEDRDTRRTAVLGCQRCPVLALCAQYAEAGQEPAFVWGGKDRSPRLGLDNGRPESRRHTTQESA